MVSGKKSALFLLLLCIQLGSFAQVHPVYLFQQDDTLLKRNYYDQVAKKKNTLVGLLNKENAADYKKIYDDQFEEIGELINSSRSVTAPVAHGYLQSIVQKVVAVNPELKGLETRIMFTRDWWPNAASMGEGTIVINAGLMVFLDNEAELVFVVCHELAHYYLDHTQQSITKYVETINSDAFQAELKRLSKTEFSVNKQLEDLTQNLVFNSRRHSRDNEAAADRQAFMFMKQTGYDVGAVKTCLELLDKVDDSLLYQPVALQQVFDFPGYPFKKKWIQKESAIFSQMDESDSPLSGKQRDSLKTHPDCSKRIALLADSVSAGKGGKKYLVDERIFSLLKKDFFMELTEQCYRNEHLSRNLYYSLLLLQQEANNPLAVYSIARCLNQLYDHQKNHKLGLTVDTESKAYPQAYNLLLRMLNRLRLEEIADLNWQFCRRYVSQMNGYAGFEVELKKAEQLK